MTTTSPEHGGGSRAARRSVAFIGTLAAAGAGLGLLLASSRAGHATAGGCAAAARRLGACIPVSLVSAKPYVTAGLIGLLLGALIAIATVLVWREALAAAARVRRREAPWPLLAGVSSDGRSRPHVATFTPRVHRQH